MNVIIGLDIGGSSTKIVGLQTDGSVLSTLRVVAADEITSLYGALGNYLSTNHLSLKDVTRIVLTGVGASYIKGDIFGIPTMKVNEFDAIGIGGLSLAQKESAIVVSMGTGTAFIWAGSDGTIQHLGGSGIGGGTLSGLCRQMVGMDHCCQIQKLARNGDLSHVDLTIGDLSQTPEQTLSPDMTASNFGKLSEDATPADLAAGTINLVLQAIGTMSVFACQICHTNTVILTGTLTLLEQLRQNFDVFNELYGIDYIIPPNATFATAIGAARYTMKD